jgi:hypothetical protein
VPEENGAVARVVDGTEAGRCDHGLGWLVVVQVAQDDVAPSPLGGTHHLGAGVDTAVVESLEVIAKPAVAAGKIEHRVARLERRSERDDQLGAVGEVGVRVRIRILRPTLGLRAVLGSCHRSANSRSGCLRRNRSIACRCQRLRRVKKCLSITAWYSWWTTALGTHQRSQPARIAR